MTYNILAIFIGGGIGAVLRFLATCCSKKMFNYAYYGTFFVNVLGCLLIGYVFGLLLNKIIDNDTLKLFITVGFLGGLTTFSTFNLELFEFIKNGKIVQGGLYMLLSIIIGLLFTFLGYYIAQFQFKI